MKSDFGLIFWVHLILILGVWLSPILLSWYFILVFVFLYYFQLMTLGDCILTRKQFKTSKRSETFYSYYLGKLGFNVDKRKLIVFLDYFLPWILLVVAYVIQYVGFVPILF